MTKLYDKYYDILKHVYNIMNLTNNEELKELSKRTIINTIEQLCVKDEKNKKAYDGILEEFGFVEKKVEKTIKENDTDLNQTEKDLSTKNDVEYKNAEEYVFYEIYRNKNTAIGDEFQKIMSGLISSLKSNEEDNIILYKNKYDKFISDNKDILDANKLKEYYQQIYNQYKTEETEIKKENIKEKEEESEDPKKEDGLKIKSVKRSYNSKLKNRALSLLALAGIGTFNPLVATGIGIGGYYLYKKGIKNAKNLIERNGFKIDNNDNLVDSNDKIVTKEDIGKLNYSLVKRELSKINSNGRIDSNYKKNKLTSMLLKVPSNIFKSIKSKYEQIKINKENVSEEIKDINKGLGIIK